MIKYSLIFPGQGSQSIGMMDGLAHIPIIKKTFIEASEILGKDFWAMVTSENDDINQTVNTQPLMLTAGYATWLYLCEWDWNDLNPPSFVAGHSLGEITALIATGALTFTDALKVVKKRAELMQNAVPENEGAMAAIIGLEDERVIEICKQEQGDDVLEAVNFNSPEQVVIAGTKSTLEKSLQSFKGAGAKRAILLPVSVPSHCKLMQPASISFGEFLNKIDFGAPHIPIIQNFDAVHHNDLYKIINSLTVVKGNKFVKKGASLEERAEARTQLIDKTKQALVNQLFNPVRWTETIKFMASKGVGCFIEVGPGKVLTGLNRRIIERASHVSVSNEEAIREISQFRRVPND